MFTKSIILDNSIVGANENPVLSSVSLHFHRSRAKRDPGVRAPKNSPQSYKPLLASDLGNPTHLPTIAPRLVPKVHTTSRPRLFNALSQAGLPNRRLCVFHKPSRIKTWSRPRRAWDSWRFCKNTEAIWEVTW